MNREQAKNLLPVIQAFADGETIQVRTEKGWEDLVNPDFICLPDRYRIKPEPLEVWIVVDRDGDPTGRVFNNRDGAVRHISGLIGWKPYRAVRVREVTE